MVPSTPNNRGQKFAPRRAPFQNGASKRSTSPVRQAGSPNKTESVIGSFEGIIAREQSSRERTNRYYPSEGQASGTGTVRPPRVYHAAPTRPAKAVRTAVSTHSNQKNTGTVKRAVSSPNQKPTKKPSQGQGRQPPAHVPLVQNHLRDWSILRTDPFSEGVSS